MSELHATGCEEVYGLFLSLFLLIDPIESLSDSVYSVSTFSIATTTVSCFEGVYSAHVLGLKLNY